jgi:ribonuclease HII
MDIICGIDEAGRGPLIGNVLAGAVILDLKKPIQGLKDSKKLSHQKRLELYQIIIDHSLAWGIGQATPAEIDQLNILQATFLAMRRALDNLIDKFSISPDLVFVDGNQDPKLSFPTKTIIKGDALEPCISAASILAKVTRDQQMLELHHLHPKYGFDQHMGYPTKKHLESIEANGLIPGYRMSFGPIKKVFEREKNA